MSYSIPEDLAWIIEQNDPALPPELYLMRVPDGIPLVLTGTAALIWLFAADGEDVPVALAEVIVDPPPDLVVTTHAYLDDLVERGLLVREGET